MGEDQLIEKWTQMLNSGYTHEQIKRECLDYCFRVGVGVMTVDAIIFKSMDLYTSIQLTLFKNENNG